MVCVWGEWEEFREWKRSKEWFEVGARRRAIRLAVSCCLKGLLAILPQIEKHLLGCWFLWVWFCVSTMSCCLLRDYSSPFWLGS